MRIGPAFRTDAFFFQAKQPSVNGTFAGQRAYRYGSEFSPMLLERGLQVMNIAVVGDAYAIAADYLRRTGAIADSRATDQRLLEIIVRMFEHGEFNKIRLANKAISKFEADEPVQPKGISCKPPLTAS